MNDKLKAFWLGLFLMAALALLVWLILFLKPIAGDGKVVLKVLFSNIDKISKGTRVTFGGKQVGEVKKIKEVKDIRKASSDPFGNLYIYELTLGVDSSVQVYTYDEIIFATSGLLGEKSIAIVPKATPPGAPPARNVTHEGLYGRSTDKLDQTLNKLVGVSDTFKETLEEVSLFIETNNRDFNVALKTFNGVAQEMHTFMAHANQTGLVEKMATASERLSAAMTKANTFFASALEHNLIAQMSTSFEHIGQITGSMATGVGSFGKMIQNDNFYLQFTAVLCQLHTILEDIRNFGLLYQFDRKWQRLQTLRRCYTEMPNGSYCAE